MTAIGNCGEFTVIERLIYLSWLLILCYLLSVILFCLRLVTRFPAYLAYVWCEVAKYSEAITHVFNAISNRFSSLVSLNIFRAKSL